MAQSLISGRTMTELYRYLKYNGGSYNELRISFQNCGIELDPNIKSVSTTNKDQFLDSYIVPLDLTTPEDAKKLVDFMAQSVEFFDPDGKPHPAAKALYDSLMRDGWMNQGNEFVFGSGVLPDNQTDIMMPSSVEQVLETIIKGLKHSCYPLRNRRTNTSSLSFDNEYDFQDLLHALMAPWIRDIRREDYVAQYLGTNKRVDFYLLDYSIIIEVKFVRDHRHARKIGDELSIDIMHYQKHTGCKQLWIVIVDPNTLLDNPGGMQKDLVESTSAISIKPLFI